MSSRPGGSIGAFLMSLPVSAMLLMAVFGVPKFAPGTGGESGWQNAKQFFTSLTQSTPNSATAEDPFRRGSVSRNGEFESESAEAPQWGVPDRVEGFGDEPRFASRGDAQAAGDRGSRVGNTHPLMQSRGAAEVIAAVPVHSVGKKLGVGSRTWESVSFTWSRGWMAISICSSVCSRPAGMSE